MTFRKPTSFKLLSKVLFSGLLVWLALAQPAAAFWVWSPDLGKWVNPKTSAKDTPEEQFAWAMELFNQQDWDRAIEEFEKLPEVFPTSKLAAEGVYHAGLSWEKKGDPAKAADAFQRLIDRYPYSDRIRDAIQREFEIADRFASGEKVKVIGMAVLPGKDKALELYKHIVKNAPYGTFGDQAQFKIGDVYKSMGEYLEAQKAYQGVVDEHPNSELVSKARFEIANCSMLASRKLAYNEQAADRALEEFKGFQQSFPEAEQQSAMAQEAIRAIRSEKARVNFEIAAFYEKQKRYPSAKVYFQEIVDQYPETPSAQQAKQRLEGIERAEQSPPPALGLGKVVGAVEHGLGSISAGAGKIFGGANKAIDHPEQGVARIAQGTGEGIGQAVEGTGQAAEKTGQALGNPLGGVGQAASGAGRSVSGAAGGVGSAVGGAGQSLGRAANALGGGLGKTAGAIGSGLGKTAGGVGSAIGGAGRSLSEGLFGWTRRKEDPSK